MAKFVANLKARVPDEVPGSVESLLKSIKGNPPQGGLLKDFQFDSSDKITDKDNSHFDLLPLKLMVDRTLQIQPRYHLQLWVVATDNDIESGPHEGRSRETFPFLVVSEEELLAEIAKEEEALHIKLEEVLNKLVEGRSKLDQVNQGLNVVKKADDFNPFSVRGEELDQLLDKTQASTAEVYKDYQRILREVELNRVNQPMINKVRDEICEPLDGVLRGDFVRTQERLAELRKTLESPEANLATRAEAAKTAGQAMSRELNQLIDHINQVLNQMEQIATIKILIRIATEIRDEEQKQYEMIQEKYKKFQEDIFNKAIGDDKPKDKKEEEEKKKQEEEARKKKEEEEKRKKEEPKKP